MASKEPKVSDPCWKYGSRKSIPGNKSYFYIECNFCKQLITAGVRRMKDHLAHTHRNVKPCPNMPPEVKKEIEDYLKNSLDTKQKKRQRFEDEIAAGAYYDYDSSARSNGGSDTRSIRGPMDRFLVHPDVEDVRATCPAQPAQATAPPPPSHPQELRRKVCQDIGRFFFENGVSFNCIESTSFVGMCRSIAEYGRGLKTPSRYELSNWILKEEVKTTDKYVGDVRKTWLQTGVSILSDGWKDMRGRSLINFLINNPEGTVFLKFVDASDVVKDANLLFELLDGIVEEVGEEFVVQVVTDNASNYKAAGKLLMQKRKHIYWTPCAAHCIDLMLEKIGDLPQHKNALLKARKVSNFIYNHGFVLAMMRKFTNRELIRPAVTRFATAFLTLESMLQAKQPLEAMFTSTDWVNSTWANKSEGKAIKKIILNDNTFWPSVVYALTTTRPLVKVLRMVDGEQMPAMGFIYGAMDEAKEQIAKNLGNEIGKYKEIWEIIDAKWEHQLHRDIHAAAHFLNPRFQYADNFSNHIEIKKGLLSCMEKLIPSSDLSKADMQLDAFRGKQGLFGRKQSLDTYSTRTPANWWIQFGDETPELQSFAFKILSLTCSASACERNWSMFNQVHTKRRNKLLTSMLNSLVYVMYNKKLRDRHWKKQVKGDVDPLEVEHLSSDDEWYVDNNETQDNESSGNNTTPMSDGEFQDLLDNLPVPQIEEGPSSRRPRGRGSNKRKKKSTSNKGKGRMSLIDEEEDEWEDEDDEEEDEWEE